MKTAFYCRTSSGSFTCILPDERQKLRDFFANERARMQKSNRKTKRSAIRRK